MTIVDLILEKNEEIRALEIKLQEKRINQAFLYRYPQSEFFVVTPKNLL